MSHLSQIPLRIRLTIWFLLALGIIMLLFAAFVYWQTERNMLRQADDALGRAANQTLINIHANNGELRFQNIENNPDALRQLDDDFVIYLLAPNGTLWGTLGGDREAPLPKLRDIGYLSLDANGEPWRILSQEIVVDNVRGRIQVIQEMEAVEQALSNLQRQFALGIPIALFLAGLGGFLVASRALRPIDKMTRTAQAITANDLTQRIGYKGPQDEIGRLAETFDGMLDRLQKAFLRERRFTGDAAHELRTPLAALKGRIGVTLTKPREPAQYVATLEDMETQVDRLSRLSNDLLFMARLDQVQLRREQEVLQVDDFLGAVVDQIRPLATAKSIQIHETIAPNSSIVGDVDLLIRLFLNLLDNAVKFTPRLGEVHISAQEQDKHLTITISDSGPGIAPEHLPNLFQRFYRVEGSRSRVLSKNGQGGAGLGLAIAHEIALAHGGDIRVDSIVGEGSSFRVQLPLEGSKPVRLK